MLNGNEGITVDSTNTYATFDRTGAIAIDASLVDPEGKLLGTSSKTILYFDNVATQGTGSYNTSNSILTIRI